MTTMLQATHCIRCGEPRTELDIQGLYRCDRCIERMGELLMMATGRKLRTSFAERGQAAAESTHKKRMVGKYKPKKKGGKRE